MQSDTRMHKSSPSSEAESRTQPQGFLLGEEKWIWFAKVFLGLLAAIALLLQPLDLQAGTYHVPADFQSIQMAIDGVSPEGDTVVVAPGSYVENIDYHGRNIFLTSLYYLEGDESYIEQTVIDGGQNGSVITFIEGEERSAVLNGFTITNGSGRLSGGYTTGGGIFIDESSPSLTNCLVTGNNCAGITGGGGIFIYRSSVHLSNLTIRENSAQSLAGGLRVTNSEIEMDSLNRCNIYLNEAASANDVFVKVSNQPHLAVFLDTATVAFHSDYFIGGDLSSVDILHGKLEPAQHDLWVSPDGDNNNSGSSPDDPLKTITYALHIIDADSLHPLTINLMPGTFSLSG
ncbi:hypothetical protein H8D51_01015 [bacterium]|nr:hypothetical protein [bacterium]